MSPRLVEHSHRTFSRIHGVNLEIRVHTPGKFASAHPMPHEMMPAKKKWPSLPRT